MKSLKAVVTIFLAIFLTVSCDYSENIGDTNQVVMKASVTEVGRTLIVEVLESEYTDGVYHVHTSEQTEFLKADGAEAALSDIHAGDVIEITYSGQVMLSYPPQVVAYKITIL